MVSENLKNGSLSVPQHILRLVQEMASLSVNTRKEMLNSTYPALYVVMFSILEGNTRYNYENTNMIEI